MSVPADSLVVLESVTKVYHKGSQAITALRGVSLTVARGEGVAIMGPSGSGKTTLLNIVGGLESPSSGSCLVDGRDLGSLTDYQLSVFRNRFVGFVFQSYNLLPELPAWRNVALPLTYAGVPPRERRRRAMAALAEVGLAGRADHLPNELSGGEEQRVAIARALVIQPRLVLADEPTGNLDSTAQADVLTCFSRLNQTGATVVVVTHNPAVAEDMQRTVTLHDGQIAG
ncbi:MAG: ABC transporter ATP-binding protein [bacterium]|nr:ABC transporter ATP-binding protein [bacterium]